MEKYLAVLIVIVATMVTVSWALPKPKSRRNCDDHDNCESGEACLRPGASKNSDKGQHKCYSCDCDLTSQCQAPSGGNSRSSATCDCTDVAHHHYVVETCQPKCLADPCDNNASCADGNFGEAVCTCKAWWTGDGFTCSDIDEGLR